MKQMSLFLHRLDHKCIQITKYDSRLNRVQGNVLKKLKSSPIDGRCELAFLCVRQPCGIGDKRSSDRWIYKKCAQTVLILQRKERWNRGIDCFKAVKNTCLCEPLQNEFEDDNCTWSVGSRPDEPPSWSIATKWGNGGDDMIAGS